MTKIAFLDTETTGLNRGTGLHDGHEMWELAYVLWNTEDPLNQDNLGETQNWLLPVDLKRADLIALNIGDFFFRAHLGQWEDPSSTFDGDKALRCQGHDSKLIPRRFQTQSKWSVAKQVFTDLQGAHLVCAVPDFDSFFLRKFLLQQDFCESWNYHLICVENLAAGKLGMQPPWKSEEVYQRLGLSKEYPGKHTAYGDVLRNIEVYRRVMGL